MLRVTHKKKTHFVNDVMSTCQCITPILLLHKVMSVVLCFLAIVIKTHSNCVNSVLMHSVFVGVEPVYHSKDFAVYVL